MLKKYFQNDTWLGSTVGSIILLQILAISIAVHTLYYCIPHLLLKTFFKNKNLKNLKVIIMFYYILKADVNIYFIL